MDVSKQYDLLVDAIIRPPRAEYDPEDLGSPEIRLGARSYFREDFTLQNPRNLKIFCSIYAPVIRPKRLPCVIYCHGNGGCRLDALECLQACLPMNFMVCTFDFSGCGLSEGQYISLGYYEKDDVLTLVNHLRERDVTTRIALWGRSMGAVTSILCAQADPSLACIIADSPFSSLKALSNDLVSKFEVGIPKMMVKLGFKMIRKSVKKRAKFDIKKLDALKAASESFVPALFGHGEDDDFIAPSHTIEIQAAYSGDSNKVIFPGDHNSMRPPFFISSLTIFLRNNMLIDDDFGQDNPLPTLDESPKNSKKVNETSSIRERIEDYFATIGGGDHMRLFVREPQRRNPQLPMNMMADDYFSDEDDSPRVVDEARIISMRAPVSDEQLLQQAIAASLADVEKTTMARQGNSDQDDFDDENDPELLAALALSAAEASKEAKSAQPVAPESKPEAEEKNKSKNKKEKEKKKSKSDTKDSKESSSSKSSKKKEKSKVSSQSLDSDSEGTKLTSPRSLPHPSRLVVDANIELDDDLDEGSEETKMTSALTPPRPKKRR